MSTFGDKFFFLVDWLVGCLQLADEGYEIRWKVCRHRQYRLQVSESAKVSKERDFKLACSDSKGEVISF